MATYDASASSCKWAPGGPKKRTKRKQNKRHKTPNEDGILEKQKPRNKRLHNMYTYASMGFVSSSVWGVGGRVS